MFVGVEQLANESGTPPIIECSEPPNLKRYQRPLGPYTPNTLDDRSPYCDDRLRHEGPQPILQLDLRLHPLLSRTCANIGGKKIVPRVNDQCWLRQSVDSPNDSVSGILFAPAAPTQPAEIH
jgi:hypothetical protein